MNEKLVVNSINYTYLKSLSMEYKNSKIKVSRLKLNVLSLTIETMNLEKFLRLRPAEKF